MKLLGTCSPSFMSSDVIFLQAKWSKRKERVEGWKSGKKMWFKHITVWIRINQDKPSFTVKGSQLETHMWVVGYRLNRLVGPVFMAGLCGLSLVFVKYWRVVPGFIIE